MIRELEGDYDEVEENDANDENDENEDDEGENENQQHHESEEEKYEDEQPDHEEIKVQKEREEKERQRKILETRLRIKKRMKSSKYFDNEAELGSDHEENDDQGKNINTKDYEELLDKQLELHNEDIEGLIDNTENGANIESLIDLHLKEKIESDMQNTVDVIKAITSKGHRSYNNSHVAAGLDGSDGNTLWARMREQENKNTRESIKNNILKVVKEQGLDKEFDEDEQRMFIEEALKRKIRLMNKNNENQRQSKIKTTTKTLDQEDLIEDRSRSKIVYEKQKYKGRYQGIMNKPLMMAHLFNTKKRKV